MNATVLDRSSSLPYSRMVSGTPGSIGALGSTQPTTVLYPSLLKSMEVMEKQDAVPASYTHCGTSAHADGTGGNSAQDTFHERQTPKEDSHRQP